MFQKFMNKKDFHPGSKWNIQRVWMAEQKQSAEEQKERELAEQYKREQEKFENRQLISQDEKLKLGLSFIYDAPPGFKDKNKDTDGEHSKPEEEEVKFEWLKGAPREAYTKDLNLETHVQPFGIPVRNVRCIKCHKWGHVNTDRECPLHNKSISTEPSSLADVSISDPLKLMQDMKNDGLALKQNALGRVLDKDDPNQQYLPSDDDGDDPELAFLATLNEKQKRKLLRKLDKLEKKEHMKKKKKKKKHKESSSESEDEKKSKAKSEKKTKKIHTESCSDESSTKKIGKRDNDKRENEFKYREKKGARIRKDSRYSSGSDEDEKMYLKRKRRNSDVERTTSEEGRNSKRTEKKLKRKYRD